MIASRNHNLSPRLLVIQTELPKADTLRHNHLVLARVLAGARADSFFKWIKIGPRYSVGHLRFSTFL